MLCVGSLVQALLLLPAGVPEELERLTQRVVHGMRRVDRVQGTSARAGAALLNQILVLPVGQGQNLKS